jgi:nucleolar protein 56
LQFLSDPLLYEIDSGFIVVQGEQVLAAEKIGSEAERGESLRKIGEDMKQQGISRLRVSSIPAKERMEELGIETSIMTDEERDDLDSRRLVILARAGLARGRGKEEKEEKDEEGGEEGRSLAAGDGGGGSRATTTSATAAEALVATRERAIAAAEQQISEQSSREDLHLVNTIQALDELDRFLNITTERTTEWYSLHFPELQDILKDNLALVKLIIEIGRRGTFDEATLEKQGLGEKKAEAIVLAAERSKGGSISEKDMRRIAGLADLAVKTAAEREKLAEAVDSTMGRIAPNITEVAGATIGARLIARAGGLERMARLPASTIQVLGAEKALFRSIRTGSRPPKHGILFQHEAVHMAPKWQRGKIARTLANKIAIAARIDYYRGEKAGGELTSLLEKRLQEIKIKYKEAPAKWQSGRVDYNQRPQRRDSANTRRGRDDKRRSPRSNPRWKKT